MIYNTANNFGIFASLWPREQDKGEWQQFDEKRKRNQ